MATSADITITVDSNVSPWANVYLHPWSKQYQLTIYLGDHQLNLMFTSIDAIKTLAGSIGEGIIENLQARIRSLESSLTESS